MSDPKKSAKKQNPLAAFMNPLLLSPFDPAIHKPQDVGLGGLSTEYIVGVYDDYGKPMNIPSVWWDETGMPHILTEENARSHAIEYERETGKRFPRFRTFEDAENAARARSLRGGATKTPLARDMTFKPLYLDETDEMRANRGLLGLLGQNRRGMK